MLLQIANHLFYWWTNLGWRWLVDLELGLGSGLSLLGLRHWLGDRLRHWLGDRLRNWLGDRLRN